VQFSGAINEQFSPGVDSQVTLKPKDGVLWAHPTLKAKGLTEASPMPLILVAEAGFSNYMQIDLDPFPLAV